MIMTLQVSWPLIAPASHSWSSLVWFSALDWTNALVSLIFSYNLFPWFWGLALEPQQGVAEQGLCCSCYSWFSFLLLTAYNLDG